MTYAELTEKSDLSCEGCCFNKYMPDASRRAKRSTYGCVADDTEPFKSCKQRHVIFQIAPSE